MCFGREKAKEDFMQSRSSVLSGIRIESKDRLLCSYCSTHTWTVCGRSLFELNGTGMGSKEGEGRVWKRERTRTVNVR